MSKLSIKCMLLFLLMTSANISFAETALIIIDMQTKFATRQKYHKSLENIEKTQRVLSRQIELIRIAKANELPIFIVEYQGCGATNCLLTREVSNYEKAVFLTKNQDGLFDDPRTISKVREHLESRGITDLVIAGANGGACVKCSIAGAISEGYKVWADRSAIIDFNSKSFVLPYVYRDGQISISSHVYDKFFQPRSTAKIDKKLATHHYYPILSGGGTAPQCRTLFLRKSAPSPSLFSRFFTWFK